MESHSQNLINIIIKNKISDCSSGSAINISSFSMIAQKNHHSMNKDFTVLDIKQLPFQYISCH